jgi:hypothetical protein
MELTAFWTDSSEEFVEEELPVLDEELFDRRLDRSELMELVLMLTPPLSLETAGPGRCTFCQLTYRLVGAFPLAPGLSRRNKSVCDIPSCALGASTAGARPVLSRQRVRANRSLRAASPVPRRAGCPRCPPGATTAPRGISSERFAPTACHNYDLTSRVRPVAELLRDSWNPSSSLRICSGGISHTTSPVRLLTTS